MVESLLDMPIIIGSFYFYTKDDMLRSVEHHRQIIAALRARDAECAQIAMRFHLASTHLLFRSHRKSGQ
jgi:DNA-binding GntR family transcriptional regulator